METISGTQLVSLIPHPFHNEKSAFQWTPHQQPSCFLVRWRCRANKSWPSYRFVSNQKPKLVANRPRFEYSISIRSFRPPYLNCSGKLDTRFRNFGRQKIHLRSDSPPLRSPRAQTEEEQKILKENGTLMDDAGLLEDNITELVPDEHESEDEVHEKVRVEISSSVMKMLQGMEDGTKEEGMGLIENNLRKRRAKLVGLQDDKQGFVKLGDSVSPSKNHSQDQSASKMQEIGIETKDLGTIFLENNSVSLPYTKTFNELWPETVLSFMELLNNMANRTSSTRKVLENMQLDAIALKEVVQNDLEYPVTRKALHGKILLDRVLQIYSCVTDQEGLHKNVFQKSSFLTEDKSIKTRYGVMFLGKIIGDPSFTLQQIQNRLEQNYKGLSALLLQAEPIKGLSSAKPVDGKVWCLIAQNRSIWSFANAEPYNLLLGGICLAGAVVGSLQFDLADPGLEHYLQWEKALVPLGLVGVVAGGAFARKVTAIAYNVPNLVSFPLLLPVLHQGAIANLVLLKGCLPSRSCLLDLSVIGSCGPLAISSLFALLGAWPSLIWNQSLTTVADFRGCLFVPSDLFSYSFVLTWMLEKLSIATFLESGKLQYVLNPLSLVSLLGFNLTFAGLIPGTALDGGRILTAVFGRTVQRTVAPVLYLLTVLSFCLKSPLLGLLWVAIMPLTMAEDLFQRDEVSEPNYFRKAIGLILVSAGLLSFVPVLF
ncbi:hypothetical protein O6H91_05G079600 [Diphasiastrum complanatum]|uniref:Uncharacterized protein n=1 Tax=Diphasiastrum complanatum TaxID=34168 RepID=A0ACC2DQ24_DIPCM|nr:hypothetical protein O6H91_05G079600 [Diphasiastrum complanatum]